MTKTKRISVRAAMLSIALTVLNASASSQSKGDYPKFEVYGGYSYERISQSTKAQNVVIAGIGTLNITDMCSSAFTDDLGPNLQRGFYCSRRGFNGFDASVTRYVTRYIGLQGDVSAQFKTDHFVDSGGGTTTTVNTREHFYNVLGGIQFKNNKAEARIKPFAHGLFGAARYTARLDQTIQPDVGFNFGLRDNFTAFAMKIGAGFDVRVGRRIDIRVIELDYNPIFGRDRKLQTVSGPFTVSTIGRGTDNFSFGAGIVFH